MNPIITFRLLMVLLAAGFLIWGIRTDEPNMRWVGIACLVIALLLRFVKPRQR